ncbi:unnamed protein product [Cylicocyclus nassatus]|uniref:BTB domain-containing protein n=1 Tax=Cylicocyclus nassatus TaxID=53992 RepID=A0AA36M688_CYLNA|nr:unnamed protein product [Cylicocyclus nassatus]
MVESYSFARRVKINVGGTVFETSLPTLTSVSDSMFSALIADRWQNQEELFIDRDPTHFAKVLNYLRNCEAFLPPRNDDSREDLQREAESGDKVQWTPRASTYSFEPIHPGHKLTCTACGSNVTYPDTFVSNGTKKETFLLVKHGETEVISRYSVPPFWASFQGLVVTADRTCCRVKWSTGISGTPKIETHTPKSTLRLANTR